MEGNKMINKWSKIGIVILVLGIMAVGYGGKCGKKSSKDKTVTTGSSVPTSTPTPTNWVKVAAGGVRTFAIATNGTLWAWGYNEMGLLGTGDAVTRTAPAQIGLGTNWSAIAAGEVHTIALKTDGTMWSWGANSGGQLGIGSTDNIPHPNPLQVGTDTDWTDISCGYAHTIARKTNSTIWTWGWNELTQLGLGDTLTRDAPTSVGTGTNWTAINCGNYHTLAISTTGSSKTLWAWGRNEYGQLGLGDQTARNTPAEIVTGTDWATVAGGYLHTFAISTTGGASTLWACGENELGQLGLGYTSLVILPITQVGTESNWATVGISDAPYTGGQVHVIAVKTNGTLWSWGANSSGQLGIGSTDTNAHSAPLQVGTDTNWSAITLGNEYTIAIKTDGTLWSWGKNTNGQLGLGNYIDRTTPTQIGQ